MAVIVEMVFDDSTTAGYDAVMVERTGLAMQPDVTISELHHSVL